MAAAAAAAAAAPVQLPIDPNWLTFGEPTSRWALLPEGHITKDAQISFIKLIWMLSKNYKNATEEKKAVIKSLVVRAYDGFHRWIRLQHALKKLSDEHYTAVVSTIEKMKNNQAGGKRSRHRKNKTRKHKGGAIMNSAFSIPDLSSKEPPNEKITISPELLIEINDAFLELNRV